MLPTNAQPLDHPLHRLPFMEEFLCIFLEKGVNSDQQCAYWIPKEEFMWWGHPIKRVKFYDSDNHLLAHGLSCQLAHRKFLRSEITQHQIRVMKENLSLAFPLMNYVTIGDISQTKTWNMKGDECTELHIANGGLTLSMDVPSQVSLFPKYIIEELKKVDQPSVQISSFQVKENGVFCSYWVPMGTWGHKEIQLDIPNYDCAEWCGMKSFFTK